ncbi:uncharacterized protein [Drosophila kikkawai]|uniref:Uncharacterized protein isoform X1 n=2 Tax=Drosophila kikkawai TaxID=30033 RepID=A0A6P4IME6_DROKI|nr:uncharacterized protein LOC108075869 isoform X1 [Drosophila kikkawai]
MDSSYKQRAWMNSRGTNNASWAGFLSGRDTGTERSSLSMAGWSPYDNSSRRLLASSDMSLAPQRSGDSRWSRVQSEWNETRVGASQAGLNSWSGPSNGNPRVIQNQPQQQQHVQMQSNAQEPSKGQAEGFLRGFNSAARDWFYRYMNMGCSPDEARERVLERHRSHPESLDTAPHGVRYPDPKAQVERRNPGEERRRPLESDSDTLGNVLKSFNGACRKWYQKHLENGFTPEEAVAKILEYRRTSSGSRPVQSSIAPGDRKRPVDSNARDGSKKPRKSNEKQLPQGAKVTSGKDHLAVAVVAMDYPKLCLKNFELTKIENALLEEMKKGWKHSLNFVGIKYRQGMIVVTCLDEASKEWLEQVVPKITAVKGTHLRIYKEDEIPNTKAITFYVPRAIDEPNDVILRSLKGQNTDLKSGNWSILRSFPSKSKKGKVMTLTIGDKSLELISKRGMTISYHFDQLTCHIAREPVSESSKKKVTEEVTADLPEIDLTEEDEDIELSGMTVLDEVQCDDDDENESVEIADEEHGNGNEEYGQQYEEDEQ